MNIFAVVIIYAFMSAFDLSVIAGTVWLIVEHSWSPWWFILTIIICQGSSPRRLILASQGIDSEINP